MKWNGKSVYPADNVSTGGGCGAAATVRMRFDIVNRKWQIILCIKVSSIAYSDCSQDQSPANLYESEVCA